MPNDKLQELKFDGLEELQFDDMPALQFGMFKFGGGGQPTRGVGGALPVPTPLETRIAQRPDMMGEFVKEITTLPTGQQFRQRPFATTAGLAMKPAVAGLKFLGGGFQRGLAIPANIGMKLQEAPMEVGVGPKIRGLKIATQLPGEIKKAITGEKLGELGDIARKAGWPEPIAATAGFFASMGIANLATRGKLIESTKKAGRFATSKLPKVMGKDYLTDRAKLAGDALDDLYGGLSKEYDDLFNIIGDKPLYPGSNAFKMLQDVLDDLPSNITNKMVKDGLMRKMSDGTFNFGVQPTMNVLIRMKNFIRKALPKNVLSGRQQADMFQGNLKYQLGKIRNIMAEGNPELKALNARYRQFMQMRSEIGNIIWDKFGNPKSSGLASLFKPGAERAKQISFEKFTQLWPQAQQIMKDSAKFSSRQAVKAGLRKWGPWIPILGGGGYMGMKWLGSRLGGGGFEGGGGGGY